MEIVASNRRFVPIVVFLLTLYTYVKSYIFKSRKNKYIGGMVTSLMGYILQLFVMKNNGKTRRIRTGLVALALAINIVVNWYKLKFVKWAKSKGITIKEIKTSK